jgi:hypothetical protein
VTIEINNHIRALINKQIFSFMAMKTHVIVFHLMNQMFCVCICNWYFSNEKKVNVFKVKDLEIYENGVQSQKEESALKRTF